MPMNATVITHRSVAPRPASELMVSVVASYPRGCWRAASVHPPTSRTGAVAADITAHHGTSGFIGECASPVLEQVPQPALRRVEEISPGMDEFKLRPVRRPDAPLAELVRCRAGQC